MAQTFYPITPTEITAGSANDWVTMDASAVVPADATGVILHIVSPTSTRNVGVRKPGSTDDRHLDIRGGTHYWTMIGVDANRYFEAYVESTTDIDIYVVGYTMAGVTFNTNADDKSLGTAGSFQPIDCSGEASGAIGLIWEVVNPEETDRRFGFRKNGSSDDRPLDLESENSCGAIIGCDASQICEGEIEHTDVDFFLVGYVTDGATFNTNATDVSLGGNSAYIDLDALPATANMGFIEVDGGGDRYGLRKNGESGGHADLYRTGFDHPWAIVACDASRIIEGKVASTNVDFFVVGYSTAVVVAAVELGAFYQRRNPFGLNIQTCGQVRAG